jgi:hypothetical protein
MFNASVKKRVARAFEMELVDLSSFHLASSVMPTARQAGEACLRVPFTDDCFM